MSKKNHPTTPQTSLVCLNPSSFWVVCRQASPMQEVEHTQSKGSRIRYCDFPTVARPFPTKVDRKKNGPKNGFFHDPKLTQIDNRGFTPGKQGKKTPGILSCNKTSPTEPDHGVFLHVFVLFSSSMLFFIVKTQKSTCLSKMDNDAKHKKQL